ncbi:hypothetical protein HJFPF1_13381 [Paramyrothecium foliicola]|nr:hypothetical protein HJFPF1_13381 [Paramyrothecium foliicola]
MVLEMNATENDWDGIRHPDFVEEMERCAREIGLYALLDPRMLQVDDTKKLHISNMGKDGRNWLRSLDMGYKA